MRYCGKRGGSSLEEMVRPVKDVEKGGFSGGTTYKCPDGYKPCNEDFFERSTGTEAGHDFVVCILYGASIKEACPITGVAFEIDPADADLYDEIVDASPASERKLYLSRKVMSHGIE